MAEKQHPHQKREKEQNAVQVPGRLSIDAYDLKLSCQPYVSFDSASSDRGRTPAHHSVHIHETVR